MSIRTVTSFCRLCSGFCGVEMEIEDGRRIVSIRGDKNQSMTKGYACFKGLQAEDAHHSPRRLLQPLKRQADGSFLPIASEQALDEIAGRLRAQIDRGGIDSVALFAGNGSIMNSSSHAMHRSFLSALGCKQYFTTLTIDQSGWAVGQRALSISICRMSVCSSRAIRWSRTVPRECSSSIRHEGLRRRRRAVSS